MRRYSLGGVFVALFVLLSTSTLLFGQGADRGVIEGFITDSSGAAIPQAKITVTNQDTGVKVEIRSDSAGAYGTPNLVLGTYSVQVEKEGFATFLRTGIILMGGVHYRQDATLQVGMVTQTIEITGASTMINTQTPEVSHSLGERYYTDLPAVMGADIRLAESLLQVQPGYIPLAPNGDAMFRGSQFQSRINGGQTMSTENWFDGAAFGYAEGHQQTQESSLPYDSIKEMKVIENQFSAQYGHTSGGIIMYTTKSGTNDFHGDIYDYLISGKTNARTFFLPDVLPLTQNNAGFAIGGPVWIPKVYNGKNRTFFFTNYDWLKYTSTVNTGYVNYIPSLDSRTGDFSGYLGNQLLDSSNNPVVDALGRPIYQGEIFNPATTRLVGAGNVPVRDGYGFDPVTGLPIEGQANIIPADDSLRSDIAAKIIPLWQKPDRDVNLPVTRQNGFGGFSDDNDKIDVRTWLLRLDHQVNDKLSLSNTFYMNHRPRTAHCGTPMGCKTEYDGQLQSAKNDTFFGQGFYQLITNHYEHLQFSWIIKPNLFNHTTLAYDRWTMGGHPLSAGVGWNTKLDLKYITDSTAGPPGLGFAGGTIPYTAIGNSWTNGYEVNNRYQFVDDLTWIKGKHTLKAGWEYRFLNVPQKGWALQTGGNYNFNANETAGYDAAGNVLTKTGDSFASMILGQVDNAYYNIPTYTMWQDYYTAPWVNDDIKVTPKLTLTIGLRGDYQSSLVEQHNRTSWFDPTAPNPAAGGIPGAMVFGGFGPGLSGKRNQEDIHWNWGPRFGFAYSPDSKNVIRGGYGIYYAGVNMDQWMGKPQVGYQTTPTAPNVSNGRFPAFWWDDGFPASVIKYPPNIDPSVANGTSPVTVQPDQETLPRYQNWSVSYQRQLTSNMMIDIDYVGNHGTRLVAPAAWAGLSANKLSPAVFNQYTVAELGGSPLDVGVPLPYPTFSGSLAQALRPWPQFQDIAYRSVPVGQSTYHALQILFEKRMANDGMQFRAAYTHSRLLNDGAEAGHGGQTGGQFGGNSVQNPICVHQCEYAHSVDDVPNYLGLSWIYELPFGPGKHFGANSGGVLGRVIGGWKVAATQVYTSGRPLQISMNNDMGGLIFNNGKRPNVASTSGVNTAFKDPNADRYLLSSAWSDPGPLTFGNAPRSDANNRGPAYYNEDINIMKDTRINERSYVRFEFQMGNMFNRVDFCLPNQTWTSPDFGKTGSQCNIPRRIQFGLTLNF